MDNNTEKLINDIPKNVYDRLEYLEFMLRFRGWISRTDLTERFGLSDAAATRDIRKYKDFAEENLTLNQRTKKYEIVERSFKPIFKIKISSALSKIKKSQICEALGMEEYDGVLSPPRLSWPKIEYLSVITRAISGKKQLNITYRSVKNGKSNKTISPHAIFDNGIHWYIRAYDEEKNTFRSYAITRIVSIDISPIPTSVSVSADNQWNRIVKLEIIPHPNRSNVPYPETIEHDFDMEKGCLNISVRATVVGYWLHSWNVDCTENHTLKGYNYQLWLKNHATLYDVESKIIAPGLSTYEQDITSN